MTSHRRGDGDSQADTGFPVAVVHPVDSVLRIDMVRCAAHGICARVMRERISLDPWGFPVVDPDPLDNERLLRQARRAAHACPQHAVLVHQERRATPRNDLESIFRSDTASAT